MTKFGQKSFTVGVGSDAYRENYDRIFRPKGEEAPAAPVPAAVPRHKYPGMRGIGIRNYNSAGALTRIAYNDEVCGVGGCELLKEHAGYHDDDCDPSDPDCALRPPWTEEEYEEALRMNAAVAAVRGEVDRG